MLKMVSYKTGFCFLALLALSSNILCQEPSKAVRDSVNAFTVNLLKYTAEEAGDSLNIALSPYTVWTLLTILSEGAKGNTLKQLETALELPTDKNLLRNSHRNMSSNLLKPSNGVNLLVSNAIFTTIEEKLDPTFQKTAKKFYSADVIPTDFKNINQAVASINQYIAAATKNQIHDLVNAGDVSDAEVFLTSAMHFKGFWKTPFNKTATRKQPFYNENGDKVTGEVEMMYQAASFPYTRVDALRSYALELPYGDDGRAAMLVLLPYKKESVLNVLKLLTKMPIIQLMKMLETASQDFEDEEVRVYLPKFTTVSELNLNVVLDKMGIKDIFNSVKSDLLGMFPHPLYVNRVIQKAVIAVDEEGTEASAAAGASLINKSPPPKFEANKPFVYFIVDKLTGCVIFSGKITNANFT